MKKFAVILTVLLLIAAGATVYVYLTSSVTVVKATVTAVEASSQPGWFAMMKEQAENKAVLGTAFSSGTLGDISDYQILTFTIRLRNGTSVDADLVEVQITPRRDADVLQTRLAPGTENSQDLPVFAEENLPKGTEREFTVYVLTAIDAPTPREFIVSYYMWGKPIVMEPQHTEKAAQ